MLGSTIYIGGVRNGSGAFLVKHVTFVQECMNKFPRYELFDGSSWIRPNPTNSRPNSDWGEWNGWNGWNGWEE